MNLYSISIATEDGPWCQLCLAENFEHPIKFVRELLSIDDTVIEDVSPVAIRLSGPDGEDCLIQEELNILNLNTMTAVAVQKEWWT